ncbi:MAG: TIGR00159 family protein [Chloroflexi bacterium]|nr:TIGR00159 family protein [Chloroflexota bacterium]
MLIHISLVLARFDWTSLVDILLVTLLFFLVLSWLQGTRGMAILRGVFFLTIAVGLLVRVLEFPALNMVLRGIFSALVVAIPVIFAPELRQALERLGRLGALPSTRQSQVAAIIDAVVQAVSDMSRERIGALIVFERTISLGEYIRTGVLLDALVSRELILQLFYPNTPLHDGAVIIGRGRIQAAGCILPLTDRIELPSPQGTQRLGLRHRAALGITEVSDAIALVVSEETGRISIMRDGRLIPDLSPAQARELLLANLTVPSTPRLWPLTREPRTRARARNS